MDHDGDSILERMAKFSRSDLITYLRAIDLDVEELEYLHGYTAITLTLTGSLTDGTEFEGEDTIIILEKGKHYRHNNNSISFPFFYEATQ